ncbi:unnamed protein product [Symbiodinium pilosum]|uniref:Uncharacterized protein n=1 Tax=Symbiodinium pilosum TaxID=2952 RepID=A0A812WI68_SYMPI|nr:unnamed protein product [Symbiodinium pilosum]
MTSKKSSVKVHDEKVVPFPKALSELQQVAQLTFKVDKMKLWHHGEHEIKFSKDYDRVRDGDLVEVWTNKRSPFPNLGSPLMQSTLHADFVHHSSFMPPPKAKKDDGSVLTEDQMNGKFEGATIYKEDYTEKPLSARLNHGSGGPNYAHHFLHHAGNNKFATTYTDHYVRHNLDDKTGPNVDIRSSTLTSMSKGRRFSATSSYDKDFNKASDRPTKIPDRHTGIGNDSTLTNAVRKCPFEAESIYQESYLEHPFCKEPGVKPMGAARGKHAFKGNSEYKEQYYKKGLAPRLRLRHHEQWEF